MIPASSQAALRARGGETRVEGLHGLGFRVHGLGFRVGGGGGGVRGVAGLCQQVQVPQPLKPLSPQQDVSVISVSWWCSTVTLDL